jgi:hypothetical protein
VRSTGGRAFIFAAEVCVFFSKYLSPILSVVITNFLVAFSAIISEESLFASTYKLYKQFYFGD